VSFAYIRIIGIMCHTFAVWHYFIKSAETHDDPNSNINSIQTDFSPNQISYSF